LVDTATSSFGIHFALMHGAIDLPVLPRQKLSILGLAGVVVMGLKLEQTHSEN
jgi:hypothetical protein